MTGSIPVLLPSLHLLIKGDSLMITQEQKENVKKFLASIPPEDAQLYGNMMYEIGLELNEVALQSDNDMQVLLQGATIVTWFKVMDTVMTTYKPKHLPIGFGRE
jgi:hypothetical protein